MIRQTGAVWKWVKNERCALKRALRALLLYMREVVAYKSVYYELSRPSTLFLIRKFDLIYQARWDYTLNIAAAAAAECVFV
jgi:hypothetical protein